MKVSVVIPCYNGEEYIGQTLGSLLDQTRPADEIIVVDDGSTDRSAEIALSFGNSVTVLSKMGGGAPMARNCGADHASGDAIMFLDADDVLAPDVLEHLLDELKRNPVGVVACPWYRLEKIGSKWVKRPPSCAPLDKHRDYLSGWLTGWYHMPASILWSRQAYETTGGWDSRAYVNNDGDLMMRALAYGVPLKITDKGASFYRRMPEEKLTESLSGARFTRKGREAQIYVTHKIAQMLEDRCLLNAYRKPVTKAFEKYRNLCKDQYPDLGERCSELILRFGEPHYRLVRKFGRSGLKGVHSARRMGGLLKNKILLKILDSKTYSAKECENYEEIRYGIDTWQKYKKAGKKGEVKEPSNPEVSIILPMSDDIKSFNTSLRSVLNQEFENFEIIVIGSKHPGTLKSVVGTFEDSRIRFVGSENNGDLVALRNLGLKKVKGDFVAFLDPGDEWYPDKLSKQILLFNTAPDRVGLVYSGVEIKGRNGETTEISPKERGDIYRELLLKNIIGNCSGVMIRRKVIPAAGFFDESLSVMAEHDYWLRIARYFVFDFVEEPLLRNHSGGSGSDSTNYMDGETGELFSNKHQRELEREGVDRKLMF